MPDLKLRYPQPHLTTELTRDRLKISRFYVNLTRALYETAFPTALGGYGSDLETLMVLLCVFIGDAEGRPTTPTKIAAHAGLPRATVYRRLEQLIKINRIKRVGRSYYIAPGAAAPDDNGRLANILSQHVGK